MTQDDIEYLKTLPRFRGIGDTEFMGLARCVDVLEPMRPGKVLFEQGDPSDGAYIVRSGQLTVEVSMPDGSGRVVAHLGPGTMVGELCLIEDAPRALRVKTAVPTVVMRVDRERFEALRRKGHSGAYKLIRSIALTVCDRLCNTNMQIEEKWQGVTASSTEMEVVRIKPQAGGAGGGLSAWDRLRGLFGRD